MTVMVACMEIYALFLATSIIPVIADYPPHEIQYRIHPIELFPREARHSRFCAGRQDGIFPHRHIDLGDPRCSFAMCSNQRTIVHSCPRGSRTDFFYFPILFPKAAKLARKNAGKAGTGMDSSLADGLRAEFKNPKSTHAVCQYLDIGGVCGTVFPDFNAFVLREQITNDVIENRDGDSAKKKMTLYKKHK